MVSGRTDGLDLELLASLHDMADALTFRVHINSGFRPEDEGEHGLALAADIAVVGGWQRRRLVEEALPRFPRIGVYDKHIHVGIDKTRPNPVLWVGISR